MIWKKTIRLRRNRAGKGRFRAEKITTCPSWKPLFIRGKRTLGQKGQVV